MLEGDDILDCNDESKVHYVFMFFVIDRHPSLDKLSKE